jgi:hypothetical protein
MPHTTTVDFRWLRFCGNEVGRTETKETAPYIRARFLLMNVLAELDYRSLSRSAQLVRCNPICGLDDFQTTVDDI